MGDAAGTPAATPSGDGEPGGEGQPGREAPGEEEASPAWRVKVYRLSDLGTWDDQGTGHARVEYIQVCFACAALGARHPRWCVLTRCGVTNRTLMSMP